MKIGLANEKWTMPSGDEQARAFARVWQSELNAFGWKDDKLEGIGDARRHGHGLVVPRHRAPAAEEWIRSGPPEEVVGTEEVSASTRTTCASRLARIMRSEVCTLRAMSDEVTA